MPDNSLRELLAYAEDQSEPRDEFVEFLSVELTTTIGVAPSRKRRGMATKVGIAAVLMTVFAGLTLYLADSRSEEAAASAEALATSSEGPGALGDGINALPLSVVRACDSFLIGVASIVRSGVDQPISYPVSSDGAAQSAASLYRLRDELSHVADLYVLRGPPSPLTDYGFSAAISELGKAALFVQLGEHAQVVHHLTNTQTLLRDLADEPGLKGCLEF